MVLAYDSAVRRLLLLVVAALMLAACREPDDPVASTVNRIVDAAEERDAGDVMAFVSTSYESELGGRTEVERALRRYFFAYNAMDIRVHDLQTERSGSSGTATFRVQFIGTPKSAGGMDQFLPRSATYRFQLWLVEEEGDWRVSSAHWVEEGRS